MKSLKVSIFLLISFMIMISCKENPSDPPLDLSKVRIQLLDSATSQPLVNKTTGVFYLAERIEDEPNIDNFIYVPNYGNYRATLEFNILKSEDIRITLNNSSDLSIIKELVNQKFESAGRYMFDIDILQFPEGFHKLYLYRDSILSDSIPICHPMRGIIFSIESSPRQFGNGVVELTTDENGYIEIDLNEFKYFGGVARFYLLSNTYAGTYKVIEGFQIGFYNKNYNMITKRILLKDLVNNQMIWKFPYQ